MCLFWRMGCIFCVLKMTMLNRELLNDGFGYLQKCSCGSLLAMKMTPKIIATRITNKIMANINTAIISKALAFSKR